MKIAIYSGSFNPIHNGHIAIAEAALEEGFDEVWMIVSPQNPHKKEEELWPFEMRFKMVELAVKDRPRIKVSDCENDLPRPSYTIKTLEFLQNKWPRHQFRLLIGGDNLQKFRNWKDFQRIIDQFGLLVYPRAHQSENPFGDVPNIIHFTAPLLDISSSDIRKRLLENRSITGLLPDNVAKFLLQKFKTDPQKPVF
jgi:nicotinate-nucleotide adenylyltransferase